MDEEQEIKELEKYKERIIRLKTTREELLKLVKNHKNDWEIINALKCTINFLDKEISTSECVIINVS